MVSDPAAINVPTPSKRRIVLSQQQRATQLVDALPTVSPLPVHDTQTCPICLGPLSEDDIKTGNCLHSIHKECLQSWMVKDKKLSCPVCREAYASAAELNELFGAGSVS